MSETTNGFKLRIGQYHFRIWSRGLEYGNRFGGTVHFFPWAYLKKNKKMTYEDFHYPKDQK